MRRLLLVPLYYLVVTPAGLGLRVLRDPLARRRDAEAPTYLTFPARPAPSLPVQFHWLLASNTASSAGEGLTKTILPLLVVGVSRDPAAVAGLTAANMLPWLLFALPAGALVDRWDRARVICRSNVARAAAFVGVGAALALSDSLVAVYALAFFLGGCETLADTAAPALLPAIVSPGALERANGRLSVPRIVLNDMACPPLGGLLVGVSTSLALATGSAVYLVAAVCVLGVGRVGSRAGRGPDGGLDGGQSGGLGAGRRPSPSLRGEIASGVRFVLASPAHRVTVAASALFGFCYSATMSLLVLFSLQNLHLGNAGYGLLLTVASVGAIAGSSLVGHLTRRFPTTQVARWSLVCSGGCVITLGLSGSVVTAGVAMFFNGLVTMCWNIPVMSLRQRLTPSELLGRVMSVSRLCSWGSMPLGALFAGVVGTAASVPTVFVVVGCVLVVGALVLLAPLREEMLRA